MNYGAEVTKVLLLDNDKQGNLSKAYGRYGCRKRKAPITKLLLGTGSSQRN